MSPIRLLPLGDAGAVRWLGPKRVGHGRRGHQEDDGGGREGLDAAGLSNGAPLHFHAGGGGRGEGLDGCLGRWGRWRRHRVRHDRPGVFMPDGGRVDGPVNGVAIRRLVYQDRQDRIAVIAFRDVHHRPAKIDDPPGVAARCPGDAIDGLWREKVRLGIPACFEAIADHLGRVFRRKRLQAEEQIGALGQRGTGRAAGIHRRAIRHRGDDDEGNPLAPGDLPLLEQASDGLVAQVFGVVQKQNGRRRPFGPVRRTSGRAMSRLGELRDGFGHYARLASEYLTRKREPDVAPSRHPLGDRASKLLLPAPCSPRTTMSPLPSESAVSNDAAICRRAASE